MNIPSDRGAVVEALEGFLSSVRRSDEPRIRKSVLLARTRAALHALKTRGDADCEKELRKLVAFLGDGLDSSYSDPVRLCMADLLKRLYAGCALPNVAAGVAAFRGVKIVHSRTHDDVHSDETSVSEGTAYNGWFCDGAYTDHADSHSDTPGRDEVTFEV